MSKKRFQRLLARELQSDPMYARPTDDANKQKIIRNFDPLGVGVLTANRRRDGQLVLVDGCNRVAALMEMGQPDYVVDVEVYEGLTPEEEARMFTLRGNQRRMAPASIFKAQIFAGDEMARTINRIVLGAGFHVTNLDKPGAIRTPHRLYPLYDQGYLEEVLDMLSKAWPKPASALPPAILYILADLIVRCPTADRKRLAKVLSEYSPRQWMRMIRERAAMAGVASKKAGFALFLERYNKNLSEGKGRLTVGRAPTKVRRKA